MGIVSCVPKDRLDEAEEKIQQMELAYLITKDRADTLEWYVNRILPMLTLRQNPDVRDQVLPKIVMLNERFPYDRDWGDINPERPEEQEMAAAVLGRIAYLTNDGLRPVSNREVEGVSDFSSLKSSLEDSKAIAFTPIQGGEKFGLTLDQDLLFDKGSYELKSNASGFLSDLAARLKLLDGYWINIEGHTDNLEFYETKEELSSWELSVIRAVRIVERLERYGVNPEYLIASGRGQYQETFVNTREENRKLNRRIEIILSPKSGN